MAEKFFSLLRRCRFLILLLVIFVAADCLLGAYFESYALKSGNFWLDDYEITRKANPEKIWDKVFFGNSAVISGYREDLSQSGYVNFGLDYGSMNDLEKILKSGKVKVSHELVIGINWAALCDSMETNPGYFWNRKPFEPYSYFQRDRLYAAFTGKLKSIITGKPWAEGQFTNQTKSYYYSCMTTSELQAKVDTYSTRYWSAGAEGCRENLDALGKVADYCKKNNIRLRVVLMPWNPSVSKPEIEKTLEKRVKDICSTKRVEYLDLSDSFGAECFYDLGHMNYEYGSHVFTEAVDKWLKS